MSPDQLQDSGQQLKVSTTTTVEGHEGKNYKPSTIESKFYNLQVFLSNYFVGHMKLPCGPQVGKPWIRNKHIQKQNST